LLGAGKKASFVHLKKLIILKLEDRWLDGWVGVLMGGCMDGWMDGWIDLKNLELSFWNFRSDCANHWNEWEC